VNNDFTYQGSDGTQRYTRGDTITDEARVAAILGSEQHQYVTKVMAGTHSRPEEASENAEVFIKEASAARATQQIDPPTPGREPLAETPAPQPEPAPAKNPKK
jgi:hypothetical protein